MKIDRDACLPWRASPGPPPYAANGGRSTNDLTVSRADLQALGPFVSLSKDLACSRYAVIQTGKQPIP